MKLTERQLSVAAITTPITAVTSGVLLYKSHIFWPGSVSQAHAVCQFAGQFGVTLNTCSKANTLFYVFFLVLWVSIIIGSIAGVMLWRRKHRE